MSKALRTTLKRHEQNVRLLSNFGGYREMLRSSSLPCIPYIGVTTKDLVALEELPTYSQENPSHVNWIKMTKIARIFSENVRILFFDLLFKMQTNY